MISEPGANMQDAKLFVSRLNGPFLDLYERWWDGDEWIWINHGRPDGVPVTGTPGAAMMNEKLFVVVNDGSLWERHWRSDLDRWAWESHGRPGNHRIIHGPGAAMMDEKFFVVTDDGHLWERHWRNDLGWWAWEDHGLPPGTSVSTAPGAAMMDSKLFVGTASGRLYERLWDGSAWMWVNHGTALHDQAQHVVGSPGADPKLSVVIMGDGYAEADMNAYRSAVDDQVLGALRLDQLAAHQGAMRIVRIDLVAVESGVRERRYNEAGRIISDVYRFSRLGVIPNDNWDRCWFDDSDYTDARIEKLVQRFAPDADHIVVLVNSQTWGGCSSVGPGTGFFTEGSGKMTVAHEMGHNLFTLDDEYVSDDLDFAGVSTKANTSERPGDWTTLKWSAFVAAETPLPTDAANLPAGWRRRISVGAFEGAGGSYATGLFRPVLSCRMNQNDPPWCPVCGQKIASDLEVYE